MLCVHVCEYFQIFFLYIATPVPPDALSVDTTEATLILICWEAPVEADSPISFYTINARDVDGGNVVTVNTSTNATFYNVTGLSWHHL